MQLSVFVKYTERNCAYSLKARNGVDFITDLYPAKSLSTENETVLEFEYLLELESGLETA